MNGSVSRWVRMPFALERHAHLRRGQFVAAVLLAALAAAFWGMASRLWFVAVMTFLSELYPAWATPAADERPWRRAGRLFVVGAMWAGIGMIAFGDR